MKILFTLFILTIVNSATFAQLPNLSFSFQYGKLGLDEVPIKIVTDNFGNIYIGGYEFGFISNYDFLIVKLNSSGDTLWSARYNGNANNVDILHDLKVDNSGNVYITGESHSIESGSDIVTIKYNSSGQQIWLSRYTSNQTSSEYRPEFQFDSFGNIYVVGNKQYVSEGIFRNAILILKYNPSGEIQFSKTYTGTLEMDYVENFNIDNTGNIYAVGNRCVDILNAKYDLLFVKFSPAGDMIWNKTHNGNLDENDYGSNVTIDLEGNVYIGGNVNNISDYYLAKYDTSGNKIWDRTYNGNLNSRDALYKIYTDNFNNILVTGSSVTFIEDKFSTYEDLVTIKYDKNGNQIWKNTFGLPGNFSDYFADFTIDDFGNSYLFANGYTDDTSHFTMVFSKIDTSGNILFRIWDSSDVATGYRIHLDNENNIYLAGSINHTPEISIADIYLKKYSQGSVYTITNPVLDEKWIAGEKDTITWSGGEAGTFVTLEISSDSGVSYDLIDFGVPAETGKYIWDIPENILNTRCIIQILNTATNDTLAKSPLFKIKGYILAKINSMGSYEAFDPGYHGWSYLNNANPMWPSSWYSGRFNYSLDNDPYTNSRYPDFFQSFGAINFPDWPLWVEVYGVNANYWSTFFKIYDSDGQEKWGKISGKSGFQGACFGFAASAFLNFSFKPQFISKHPGMPNTENINSLAITDSIRKYINGYFLYQFGKQSYENDLIGKPKDPKTTLREIIYMFKNDEQDIRTISIFNDPDKIFPGKNTGAHTMAPIGVRRDTLAGKFRVLLYDSNNPDDYPYILVDTVANRWSFPFLGNTWQGTTGFYLELSVSNYINRPEFTDKKIDLGNIKRGVQNIEIYNTDEADITLKNSSNQLISIVNGNLTEEISNGTAIIKKTGGNSNPIGYYIPDDDYSIEISNIKDSSKVSRVAIFKENKSYIFSRNNADSSETDKINIGNSNSDGSSGSGLSVMSPDPVQKDIKLKIINSLNDKERLIEISGVEMIQNDSLYINDISNSLTTDNSEYEFIIKNFGSEKTYVIKINENDGNEQRIFGNAFVMLPANSSHIISPNWDNLDSSTVTIYIDSGNNGSIDDSITILNEFELPVELISFTSTVLKRDVTLKWTTSSEINNAGFEIERKFDTDENWIRTGAIQGSGNTNELKSYSFIDRGLNTGKYKYRLKQIDYNGNFEYYELTNEVNIGVPEKFDLSQNYPNPFNPVTKINYDLPFDSKVQMKIYDIAGREVFTLVNEQQVAGYYTTQFNASSLASGVYFYRIISKGLNGVENIQTKKMMLVK
ncbi:MAG: T9SS type A sorting domain-containing protein [Ignavibacteria bacterium]|nr:T9SS type A sorting domain-containing protein [Ignavibacteria bacterium]